MLGIIMAGGQGTRLMPLTLYRPKPMVEVLGRPVIDYVKEAMVDAGVREIVVTTGYQGQQLAEHVATWNLLREDGNQVHAQINQESTPMGTAGSVGLLRDMVTETCVVGSGDAIASFDIADLLQSHRESNAMVTMALWEVDDPSQFGIVGLSGTPDGEVDSTLRQGYIRRFLEKPSPEEAFSNVINAGLYILEPEVFDHIPVAEKFDFSKQLFPLLLELQIPLFAKAIEGIWFDVGQPEELLRAQRTLLEHFQSLPFTFPEGYEQEGGNLISCTSTIFGEILDSVVARNCTIHDGAKVHQSLLMDGTLVGQKSTISNSVLGSKVVVGKNCIINGCVLGDGITIDDGESRVGERYPAP